MGPVQVDGYMYDDSWYADTTDSKLGLALEQRRSTGSPQVAKPESSNELLGPADMQNDDADPPSTPGDAGHGQAS